jgi:cubilin
VKKCGGLLSNWNGTLQYPTDPNSNYVHNARCAWLIKTNHTKVLNVTFTKFDLEASNEDCKFDWLQVSDIN